MSKQFLKSTFAIYQGSEVVLMVAGVKKEGGKSRGEGERREQKEEKQRLSKGK